MRDQKRREQALIEEAYQQVNESCGGAGVMVTQEPIQAVDIDTEIVPTLPGLDGWVASKITKAADYLSSVFHFLDYETNEKEDVVIDVQEIEIPVDQFNIGAEDVGST